MLLAHPPLDRACEAYVARAVLEHRGHHAVLGAHHLGVRVRVKVKVRVRVRARVRVRVRVRAGARGHHLSKARLKRVSSRPAWRHCSAVACGSPVVAREVC